MVLRPDVEGRWGRPLRLDADGRLVELIGERYADARQPCSGPLMFTGVHVVTPQLLDRIPPEGEQCVIRTAYREATQRGRVFGYASDGYWWEHSTPERYREGAFNVMSGKVGLPYAEQHQSGVHPEAVVEPGATVVEPVWVGAGAVIESGATVGPRVQLGERARVRGGVHVHDAVVWDDVVVSADAHDVVLVGDDSEG